MSFNINKTKAKRTRLALVFLSVKQILSSRPSIIQVIRRVHRQKFCRFCFIRQNGCHQQFFTLNHPRFSLIFLPIHISTPPRFVKCFTPFFIDFSAFLYFLKKSFPLAFVSGKGKFALTIR